MEQFIKRLLNRPKKQVSIYEIKKAVLETLEANGKNGYTAIVTIRLNSNDDIEVSAACFLGQSMNYHIMGSKTKEQLILQLEKEVVVNDSTNVQDITF